MLLASLRTRLYPFRFHLSTRQSICPSSTTHPFLRYLLTATPPPSLIPSQIHIRPEHTSTRSVAISVDRR
ncbi:hypothetical protein FA13DRAFT_1729476 [Coprinellus micaceus]|uniref:Uncharacterized protein n=1 Tax=Coprinellus micaceus TaxID=71717 RepID=A0A4Y7TMM3_COPMI|nr:hypothetical protein FA13DRAFT_1729476 [Coprinellus micaceus]